MGEAVVIWDVNPELIKLGAVSVRYYGLLFGLGILLGYKIVSVLFKREAIPLQLLDSLLIYIFVGTLLGARLGHCLFYDFEYFSQHPLEILLPFKMESGAFTFTGFTGLASHGGAVGVLLAIYLFCRKYQMNMLNLLDRVAVAIPVAGAFIRFGNFMNSEIYGKPTNGSLGVVFAQDDFIARHPTQLYEAFSYLAISALLWMLYQKRNPQLKGVIFGYFLVLMFSARFIIEFYKENQEAFENELFFNMGQLLSVPFIAVGVVLILLKLRQNPAATAVN
ncbi:prolipoprotein diacylglyceryl transferase [Flavobacterium sp. JP2137]|uniref:prolipoprotein diacylglyceryl transferase n=1 Tax=Flavobacterium sp. JP2137 TaxID=3414510 RepID=UPI003D2FAA95